MGRTFGLLSWSPPCRCLSRSGHRASSLLWPLTRLTRESASPSSWPARSTPDSLIRRAPWMGRAFGPPRTCVCTAVLWGRRCCLSQSTIGSLFLLIAADLWSVHRLTRLYGVLRRSGRPLVGPPWPGPSRTVQRRTCRTFEVIFRHAALRLRRPLRSAAICFGKHRLSLWVVRAAARDLYGLAPRLPPRLAAEVSLGYLRRIHDAFPSTSAEAHVGVIGCIVLGPSTPCRFLALPGLCVSLG